MSTLSEIRDGFKSTLEAAIPGLRVYETVADLVQVPAVIVKPKGATYQVGMGKCSRWHFCLYVLVSRAEVMEAQDNLDSYVSYEGANSIPLALRNAPSLGLDDVDATLMELSNYGGEWDVAKIPHVGAELCVDVLVTM